MVNLEVVVGSQFGSEGKGHVTHQRVAHAISRNRYPINIRVAGPNAGHCAISPTSGHKYAFRTIPIGSIQATKKTPVLAYIAAGSEVDLEVLYAEIEEIKTHDPEAWKHTDLVVDPEATLLNETHRQRETNSALVDRIGSTGKGIGAARADRIMRNANRIKDLSAGSTRYLTDRGINIGTEDTLDAILNQSHATIIIEGTQGYGLGLHAGHYPQCTSSDTRAIDFLAMAGISPWDSRVSELTVWMATRVYPIRVAGNSGPLQGETTWEGLGLPEEHTTVTKKVRRVGTFDWALLRQAVAGNGGGESNPQVRIALTMADQLDQSIQGATRGEIADFNDELAGLVDGIYAKTGVRVAMVTTSETTALYL